MSKKIKITAFLIVFVVAIFSVILTIEWINRNIPYEVEYSEEWVNREELYDILEFTGISRDRLTEYIEKCRYHLNYKDVKRMLELLGGEDKFLPELDNNLCDNIKDKSKAIVPRKDFYTVYDAVCKLWDTDSSIREIDYVILEKNTDNDQITTQIGKCTLSGTSVKLLDAGMQCITAITYNDKIVGIRAIGNASLENAYLKECNDNTITILYGGGEYILSCGDIDKSVEKNVCDLEWRADIVYKVSFKADRIEGNMLSIDDNYIEIEGYGKLERAAKIPIYKTYGTIEEKDSSDIVLGNMNVRYVVGEGKVCAAVLEKPAVLKNIRVLLLDKAGELLHNTLYIRAGEKCTLTDTAGRERTDIAKDTIINVDDYGQYMQNGSLRLSSESEMFYGDTSENMEPLGYEGSFEIRKYDGGYAIVNELPIENYLYHVVPSEMPVSYGIEALKTQAVCARSYAYIQMQKGDYAMYGAHVDDSVSYQVYNKVPSGEEVLRAVDDTCGEVLKYNDNVIETYYFSTSCGYTEDMTTWNLDNSNTPYLRRLILNHENKDRDLSDENIFREYIGTVDSDAYEANSRMFRWNGDIDYKDCDQRIKNKISDRQQLAGNNFKLFSNAGKELGTWEFESFGAFTGLEIIERSSSGSVRLLRVHFENCYVDVRSEYDIRVIAGCGEEQLTAADGSDIDMHNILPSAAFTFDSLGDMKYHLFGGGYGHGIGMSQCAVGAMAAEGMKYSEILGIFYQGAEIKTM